MTRIVELRITTCAPFPSVPAPMAAARHSSSVQLSKVSKVATSDNQQHPLYRAALNSRTTLPSKRASTPPRKWPRPSSRSEERRWTVVPTTRRRPPETKKPPARSV
eukprot:scaffold1849_cov66-Phaeocystis_antarctica.AAC.4